jgi:hypothetical protein
MWKPTEVRILFLLSINFPITSKDTNFMSLCEGLFLSTTENFVYPPSLVHHQSKTSPILIMYIAIPRKMSSGRSKVD